jgi:hypothetical protein
MVYLIPNCICGVCDGGNPAPSGVFEGSFCPCFCHSEEREKKAKEIEYNRTKFDKSEEHF